jgi:hypothetical protein
MNILMVCDGYFLGFSYQENSLTKQYLLDGHKVTVIASTYNDINNYMKGDYDYKISESDNNDHGARIIKLKYSFNFYNKIKKLRNISTYLYEIKPDLIYVHGISFNLHEIVKYKKRNKVCRLILDFHGDFSNSANNWLSLKILNGLIRRYYLLILLKHIDKIFPINKGSLIFMNKIYQIPYNRMNILPLGVDSEFSNEQFILNNKDYIRKKYSIPINSKVIFTGGKINRSKQIEDLLIAFNEYKHNNCYLFIVGQIDTIDMNYNIKIQNLINSNNKIIFTGWLNGNELYRILAASDIAIFPGSQSVLWQQSIGMGLITIVSKYVINSNNKIHNQNVEYLNYNNNLLILNSKDSKKNEIITYLKMILDNPYIYDDLKEKVKSVSLLHLSYKKIAEQTLN